MKTLASFFLTAVLVALSLWTTELSAQTPEAAVVDSATSVLDEFMRIRARSIPRSLLHRAEGIAIIPDVVKVGFVVGVRYGRGVVMVRDEAGAWKPPVFVTLTGGSVGWQAGVQGTDVVLVFKSRKSIAGLTRRKLILGADAAAAAGPLGREATAATDSRLRAEVYSYSRSRGVFAGVSLDGSDLSVDPLANQAFYEGRGITLDPTPFTEEAPLPASAVKLMQRLDRYTGTALREPPGAAHQDVLQESTKAADADSLRAQLAASMQPLQGILDKQWRSYLALPAEVFHGRRHPRVESLQRPIQNFSKVAEETRFRNLAERPEFQTTYDLLLEYAAELSSHREGPLNLPRPPQ